jgi:hypothetical protein
VIGRCLEQQGICIEEQGQCRCVELGIAKVEVELALVVHSAMEEVAGG